MTGGDRGLSVPRANIFGAGGTDLYFFVVILAALLCLAARNLFRTRVGRAFIALRERDYAAEVLGINVVRYKLLAFALGAAYAGVAGALTGTFLRIVNPDQFTLLSSVFFLAAVVVGGQATILGSILGATFMTLMPEILRALLELWGPGGTADIAGFLSPLREFIFGAHRLIVADLLDAARHQHALRQGPATRERPHPVHDVGDGTARRETHRHLARAQKLGVSREKSHLHGKDGAFGHRRDYRGMVSTPARRGCGAAISVNCPASRNRRPTNSPTTVIRDVGATVTAAL